MNKKKLNVTSTLDMDLFVIANPQILQNHTDLRAVWEDACKPLTKDNVEATKKELSDAGVAVISVEEAVKQIPMKQDYALEEYLAYVQV